MGLAKACFSLFRVGIGWYLWSWRRKEPPVAVPPASEATNRGAEHSLLLPRFSCFRLHPAHKKRDPKRSLSFVELEKKGTAGGRSASERGDEPRSGTLSTSPPLLLLPTPSSSQKKRPQKVSFVCGAGGSRTLVQTSDRCAFYMLILWLIVGPALDTGTQGRP